MKNIYVLPTKNSGKEYVLGKCIKELSDVKIGELVRTFYASLDEEYFEPQHIYITSDEKIDRESGAHWCIDNYNNKLVLYQKGLPAYHYNYYKKIIMSTDESISILCGCGKNCGAKESGIQDIDDEFLEWFVNNPNCEFVNVVYGLCNSMGRLVDVEKVSENHSQCTWKYKIILPKENHKKYPIGGFAPGNYMCHCVSCSKGFFGDKRAVQCENCATSMSKKPEANIIDTWLEKHGTPEIAKQVEAEAKELFKEETLEEAALSFLPISEVEHDSDFIIGFEVGAKWQSERMYSEEEAGELVYNIIGQYAKQYSIMIDGAKLNDLFEQFKKK